MPRRSRLTYHALVALFLGSVAFCAEPTLKFYLATDTPPPGFIAVSRETTFTPARGHGFEPQSVSTLAGRASSFHFTARVPHEGNYRVTVTLGDPNRATLTTIKAELRRLVVADAIPLAAGATQRVTFIVNTRTPAISPTGNLKPGTVRLKAPRETIQEAWAWDEALTLEFIDPHSVPAVRSIEIDPADVPTFFLLGDSTVCDQSKEPYASWGQMLPRWFKPAVAVANHGESGETYRDSLTRRRLDKIVSVLRPGDCVLLQFGHNDQKQLAAKTGGPFTTYRSEIKQHVDALRTAGGIPILLSPMERRSFDERRRIRPSLVDYATAARDSARELGVAFIDLHSLSISLYEALGPEKSARAFATAADGKIDNTHHNNYGAYQLAKLIVASLREQKLPPARWLVDEFTGFDPARPDDPDTFAVPASAAFTNERPLGDDAKR